MLKGKLVNILLHVLFTALIVVVPIFLMPQKDPDKPNYMNWAHVSFTLLQTAGFYFSAYVLYPWFLLKKQIALYIIAILALSAGMALLPGCLMVIKGEKQLYEIFAGFVTKVFVGLFVMGTATSYRFILDVMYNERLQKETLTMELSFLRSQVSPHFMFNALNSMVSLARKKSDLLEPALLKMSNLMHYMLYDLDEEKVSLHKEVDYLRSYIDLQTMRFGDSVKILFMVQPGNYSHCIEPMLLIPLIENAFKHGVNVAEEPEIDIRLTATEKEVSLSVSNKTMPYSTALVDKTGGIGLTNLERRLKILYPGKHQLVAQKNGNWFHASLKIVTHD